MPTESIYPAELRDLDGLQEFTLRDRPGCLHEDHRWVLPIAWAAQRHGLLPRPCSVVMFDRHPDSLEPVDESRIRKVLDDGVTVERLLSLCEDGLSPNDDDWLKAGIYLGIFRNVVLFQFNEYEIKQPCWPEGEGVQIDRLGFPGPELKYQGELADEKKAPGSAWQTIGWSNEEGSCWFHRSVEPFLLDIDLDCFAVKWRDYLFPWPEEVFEREFLDVSDYGSTCGRSGKDVLHGLIERAGLITIAREPCHCGGAEKCKAILSDVERLLFGETLAFS